MKTEREEVSSFIFSVRVSLIHITLVAFGEPEICQCSTNKMAFLKKWTFSICQIII